MKFFRPLFLPLLAVILAAPLAAQTKKAIEPSRVAFINSNVFLAEATGIKMLVRANQGLELEFSGTQSELSLLNEKLRTIVGELNKLNSDPVANAIAIAEKQAAGQKLQQELAGKQQAAQEQFGKRSQELQAPISAEIGQELRAYAKERNIDVLFDLAKLGDAVLDAKPELDVTADFVTIFNDKHK